MYPADMSFQSFIYGQYNSQNITQKLETDQQELH
jgi:hypothetical protein